jgi:hypothetical protein
MIAVEQTGFEADQVSELLRNIGGTAQTREIKRAGRAR